MQEDIEQQQYFKESMTEKLIQSAEGQKDSIQSNPKTQKIFEEE